MARVPSTRGRLKEITVGPLAAQFNKRSKATAKMYEYFSKHSLNYGLVKVNALNPPYAEVDILDENNKLLYRTRIDSLS